MCVCETKRCYQRKETEKRERVSGYKLNPDLKPSNLDLLPVGFNSNLDLTILNLDLVCVGFDLVYNAKIFVCSNFCI